MSQDLKSSSKLAQYNGKIQVLQKMLEDKVDEILEEFKCNLRRNNKMFIGSCPVHGGDNQCGINIYHTVDGCNSLFNWRCNTHHCEQNFKKTIIGLIRGILSNQKYGWKNFGDEMISWGETIKWCEDFLNIRLNSIKANYAITEQQKFIKLQKTFKNSGPSDFIMTKLEIYNRLIIPADYFIRRGYSSEILKKYDIGISKKQSGEMYGRVVIPVYDETGYYLVGCSGRTTFPLCKKCQCYHNSNSNCPNNEIRHLYTKWKNNSKFDKRYYLYNYWYAKSYIKKSGKVILVESPGNVLRLEEAGIHNSVGMFGSELSDEQQIILEKSGAFKVIILTDNDEAGIIAREKIKKQLDRTFNIEDLFVPKEYNDIGEMPVGLVKELYEL